MAAAEEILTRTLEKAGSIIDGVTCGAGMPYKLSEIAAKFGIYYYPIVSSARLLMLCGRDPTEKHQIILEELSTRIHGSQVDITVCLTARIHCLLSHLIRE